MGSVRVCMYARNVFLGWNRAPFVASVSYDVRGLKFACTVYLYTHSFLIIFVLRTSRASSVDVVIGPLFLASLAIGTLAFLFAPVFFFVPFHVASVFRRLFCVVRSRSLFVTANQQRARVTDSAVTFVSLTRPPSLRLGSE